MIYSLGRGSFIGASDGGVELGNNCVLIENVYINVFNFNDESDGRAKVIFGNDVVISKGATIHAHSGVFVGDGTIVGPNLTIVTGDHGIISKNTIYRTSPIIRNSPVVIGSNVWIGANVTILPGVSVGDNAVIAAGAVVSKNILEGTVVAGVPAKLLRKI